MAGRNIVIEGPPGTGKSQTITNAIANLLAAGRSVLFLAEKQAALDAVKRRLDIAGLGDFCLELHSDKASPRAFVKSLADRHALAAEDEPAATSDPTWRAVRSEIRAYVDALHERQGDGATPFRLMWEAIRGRSVFTDAREVLRSKVGAADGDPLRLPALRGEVEVYGAAARHFADRHGHPARSPWQRTPPADLLGDERETLMAALRTLRDRQAALDEAVAGLREIGADDAAAAVAADRSLGLAPDAAAVAAILPHDLDGLDGALALRRRALEAADSLAALGADHLADIVIERAAALNVLWRGAYASRTPAEIYAAVERRIALVRDFAAVAGELAPAAAALGLPDSTPAGHLEAVAEAVLFAAQLPPDLAGWIAVAVGGDDFARLQATARDLRREEAELRRLLPQQTQPDWPDPDLLASAVAESQRGGLAKLFGRRALREALTRLGLADGPTGYERLARVADHQRRLTAFAADRAGPAVFADAWNGLSSPFPTLGAAIAAREDAERLLRALPGGATVAAALFRLGPDGLGRLATHAGAAARYRDGRPAFGALFDSTPLHGLRAACDGEVAALGEITAKDPDRVLVTVDLPIGRLAAIGDARRAAKAAREAFDAAALAPAARSLAGDLTGVQRIVDAVVFVRTVRSAGLPEPLSAALLATPAITREALREAAATWGDAETRHAEALDDVAAAGLPDIAFVPDGERRAHVDSLLEQAPALADFVALRRLRGGLDGAGLGELLAGADRAEIAPDRLPALFDAAIAGRRAEAARRSSEPLARRTGIDLDAKRQTFVERDRRKKEADRAAVRATLLRRTPPAGERSGSVRTWTEMALLWHEFQKQKQLAPVRDLLRRAPASVRALKPCFMMSPLSLAKFLPPGSFSFDVLVIDEASQMRPEDALGAMLRARQIVVVGDPKQLPPTSFFERSAEGGSDDGEADEVDDESILERCEKVFGRLRRLKWHYRSRCESLIRFSNEQFYDGSLVTFPAARPGSFSVDLVRADGAFAARRNVVEAERLTEEAIAFMHHFAAADEPPSLGIVALNIEQRDLIEETLWRLSAGDPLVEAFQEKTGRRGEGVFVKNLENVQGDERDFVFISMTYGMAEDSTVLAQRFGPINSANGHRRLNVLFSRARLRIVLFASFGSTDIRPGTATHRGVRVLKEYLQYAETGGRAAATATGRDPDSDFEIEVAERLRKRGYDVDLQVGVSGFRIDLGVRHPDRPDTFLAGIECDGARYHASRNARDRDRLREEVLRGLGWTILRVWSTDWFDDPDTQADRLVAKLDELRRGTRPSGWLDYRIAGRAEPGAAAPSGDGAREGDTPAGGDQRDTPGGDGRRDTPAEAATAPSGLSPGEEGEKAGLVEVPPLPLFPDDVRPPDAGDAGGGDGSAADTRRPPDAPAPDIASDDAAAQAAGSTTLTNASPDAGPLTETEVWAVLAELRETVIRPASPQFEPHRSILRDAMIESLIRQRLTDPDDWFTKIPAFLRSGTNPIEKRLYLERICELVARVT